jgi:hypothetical protein
MYEVITALGRFENKNGYLIEENFVTQRPNGYLIEENFVRQRPKP